MKNSWKRIAAGAMSLAMVAGAMPANVGGLLTGVNGIVANAANVASNGSETVDDLSRNDTITKGGKINPQTVVSARQFAVYLGSGNSNVIKAKNTNSWTADDDYVVLESARFYPLSLTDYSRYLNVAKLLSGNNLSVRVGDDSTGSYVYTGKPIAPEIWRGDTKLVQGTDYTIVSNSGSIASATNVGEYTIKIQGKGNYSTKLSDSNSSSTQSGVTLSWKIVPADCEVTAPTAKTLTYTGAEQELVNEGSVADNAGTVQYKLGSTGEWNTSIPKATDAADYQVYYKVIGDNNHNDFVAETPIEVNIAQKNISNTTLGAEIDVQEYTGSEIKPEPVVKDGDKTLTKNTDYTLEYSNNTDAGKDTATVTIKGKNNYTGSKSYNFSIDYAKAPLTLSNLDGAVLVGAEFDSDNNTYTVKGNTTYLLYTNKSVAPLSTVINGVTTKIVKINDTDVLYDDVTYNYVYNIIIPDVPAEEGYVISHTNNFVGTVYAEDETTAYVSEETGVKGDLAASLVADNIVFYGDELDSTLVEISGGYSSIIDVQDVYLAADNGTKLDGESLIPNHEYYLTAKLKVDKSGDPNDDNIDGNIIYIKKKVVFNARSMSDNKYYIKTIDPRTNEEILEELTVDESIVSSTTLKVPEGYYTYNAQDQVPTIVVKNGGNGNIAAISIPAGEGTEAVINDYSSSQLTTEGAYTNAGDYSFTLSAENKENARYTGSVTITWNIQKAIAKVNITAKDDIIYDGQAIDITDFDVTALENLSEADNALAEEFIATIGNDGSGTSTNVTGAVIDTKTYDITNASNNGAVKANVHIESKNFQTIDVVKQAVIAKRKATITPDENNNATYRDLSAPTLNYTYEKAVNDSAATLATLTNNRGVIAADEALFNNTTPIYVADYTIGAPNDAKSYNYNVVDSEDFANYALSIVDDAPTFTVNPLNLNDIENLYIVLTGVNDGWTPAGNSGSYTYDGSTKEVEVQKIAKKNSGEGSTGDAYQLKKEKDFTVGGAVRRALNGTYTVQVKGAGNYTGVATTQWTITSKPSDNLAVLVNTEKYYDGTPIAPAIEFTNEATNDYKTDAEVTFKYYKNGAELTEAPKNAGEYEIVATVTAGGYADQTITGTINIKKRIPTSNRTITAVYGTTFEDPTAEEIANLEYILPADKALFENAEFSSEYSTAKVGSGILRYTCSSTDTETITAFNNYNWDFTLNVTAKSIKSDDITVEFTNGDKIILDENDFVSDDLITVKDGETPLVALASDASNSEDADFELNIEDTAIPGKYRLELVGINNYRGARIIEFTAVTPEEAANAATSLDIEFVETYVSNGKTRIKFQATAAVEDGYTVKETGSIYYNAATGTPEAELTLENVDSTIIKKSGQNDDSYLVGLLDNGNGIYARFYTIVTDGVKEYVIYASDEAVYYNYSDLFANTAGNVDVAFVETYVSSSKTRIKFQATAAVKAGTQVKETGAIYFNAATGAPEAELTLENVDGTNIKKSGKNANSYLVGLLDNGNGIYARFYTIVTDGVNDYVIYASDEAEYYNYSDLFVNTAVNLDVAFVETYVSNGKNRIKFQATAAVKAGAQVKETGAIYYNAATGTPEAELTLENVDGTNIKKSGKDANSYLVGLLDNGNGIYARFYTVVNDGEKDYVVYASDEAVYYNYTELSNQ